MARQYSPEQKAHALALYEEHGPAEAERRLEGKVNARTIATWAHREGVKSISPTKERTEKARAARLYQAEGFKARMTAKLAQIADLAADVEIDLLEAENGKPPLDKVVGARTRAIHDFQLLSDGATERTQIDVREQAEAAIKRALERRAEA